MINRVEKLKYRMLKLINAEDIQAKVDKGIERRQELYEAMKRGDLGYEDNYRYKFLMEASHQIIEKLGDIAQKFNEEFPDERFSSLDMVDVLNSSLSFLKKASGEY